ncbi:MAG: tyrosine-type recombinase/integrase [Flavobacteriales bacterium]|nr:tyrosine-type recombinase/integrase [Flavobacteriales bacterium]
MAGSFVLQGYKKSDKKVINYRVHLGNNSYFKYSTGETILDANWDKKDKCPIGIKSKKTIYRENKTIWDQLRRYPTFYKSLLNTYKLSGETLNKKIIKAEFDKEFKLIEIEEKKTGVIEAYEEFIQEMKDQQEFTPNTIKNQTNMKNLLVKFQRDKKYKILFETINSTFYNIYKAWARTETKDKKKHQNNTIGRNISALKTFLKWATDRNYNEIEDYKVFEKPSAPTNSFALNEEELFTLYNHDFTANKRLEKVRDLFCLGAFTGLRFSDYSNISKKNISGESINLTQQKTKAKISIPLNYYSKQILEKYHYYMPIISNQNLNKYIKEACEIAGIDTEIHTVEFVGKNRTEESFYKWEKISSHTARRTFASIAMSKGANPFAVMRITGHKKIETFMNYVSITENQTRQLMIDIFGAPESSLKAV